MDEQLLKEINRKIDFKTKPLGALGSLEELTRNICLVQKTTSPKLTKPCHIVFAGDHGIALSGVSAYPQEVTAQMVLNFVNGGAAINVFCRQHQIQLQVVDAGVNFDFESDLPILHHKIGRGTKNFLFEQAMTKEELEKCMATGAALVQEIAKEGCNVIGFGEMGIGNTAASSMIMHKLLDVPVEKCVGRGTGLTEDGLKLKTETLKKAAKHHSNITGIKEIMQTFMGFEMAMMCGAFLEAANQNMLILVDGFIATSVLLCAVDLNPDVLHSAIFCHQSDEQGHQLMLQYFDAKPILKLNLRLGEGTGCALAYPIIESAVRFMNEMASFDSAGVSNKV